ncbi:MAG: ferritin family protein [Endomicrobiia bacterium]
MGSIFSISEILQFAIKIEENGELFYKMAAEKVIDFKAKEMFNLLAEEEVKHKNVYSEMLAEIENYKPEEIYPEEYFSYLKSYVDNIIFNSKKAEELKVNFDTIAAINFAIQRELDSILYYLEMKNFVSKSYIKQIDKIVEEERKHFLKLTDLKNSLEK